MMEINNFPIKPRSFSINHANMASQFYKVIVLEPRILDFIRYPL